MTRWCSFSGLPPRSPEAREKQTAPRGSKRPSRCLKPCLSDSFTPPTLRARECLQQPLLEPPGHCAAAAAAVGTPRPRGLCVCAATTAGDRASDVLGAVRSAARNTLLRLCPPPRVHCGRAPDLRASRVPVMCLRRCLRCASINRCAEGVEGAVREKHPMASLSNARWPTVHRTACAVRQTSTNICNYGGFMERLLL